MYLCICVSVYLYACVPVYLYACVSVYLYVCVPVCLCVCVSVCLSQDNLCCAPGPKVVHNQIRLISMSRTVGEVIFDSPFPPSLLPHLP